MKQKAKVLGVASLGAAMLLSVAACGSNNNDNQASGNAASPTVQSSNNESGNKASGEKVKLRVVTITTDENRNNIMEQYIKPNIAQALPNVEVEFEPGGGGEDMANKLKTYNASGDMPDVFWDDAGFFIPLKNTGSIMDLTPYITKDGFLDKYDVPGALKHIDGKIYSLSSGSDTYFTPVIFYHKDMFEKAGVQVPTTFDQLLEAAKKLNDNDMVPAVTPGKGGWGPQLFLLQQMIQIGDPQAMEDLVTNKADFTNPSVIEGASCIEQLVKAGFFPKGIANLDYGPAMEMFTSKKAAMLLMFTWELPNLAKDDTVDFFPFPSASDKYDSTKFVQYWGSPLNGYAVNAKTEHPEEAVQLAEFLATMDAKYFESTGAPVSLNTGDTAKEPGPLMKKFVDWYNPIPTKISSLALNSLDAKVSAELGSQGASLLTGEYTAEQFAKAMQNVWSQNTWFNQ